MVQVSTSERTVFPVNMSRSSSQGSTERERERPSTGICHQQGVSPVPSRSRSVNVVWRTVLERLSPFTQFTYFPIAECRHFVTLFLLLLSRPAREIPITLISVTANSYKQSVCKLSVRNSHSYTFIKHLYQVLVGVCIPGEPARKCGQCFRLLTKSKSVGINILMVARIILF